MAETPPPDEKERPVKPSKAKARRPRRAKIFLNDIDAYLLGQEEERQRAEVEKREKARERILQLTINQTLDELLSLDPNKQKTRVRELIEDLHHFGDKAIEAIKMLLSEKRPKRQMLLLTMALGSFSGDKTGGAAAEEFLFSQAIGAKDRKVREAALDGLRNAKDKDALFNRSVRTFKESPNDTNKQMYAIAVLSAVGGQDAVYRLREILDEADKPQVKKGAIKALGEIGSHTATSTLLEVFDDDEAMRGEAAESLGKMHKDDIALDFGELLWDKESSLSVKLAAVRGLGADNGNLSRNILLRALKDYKQPREVHKKAIDMLIVGSEDSIKKEIADYVELFKITPADYLPQMLQPLLARGKGYTAQSLLLSFPQLNRLKKIHALRTLGRIGGEGVFDAFQGILIQEKDVSIRMEILSNITRYKSDKLNPKIANILLKTIAKSKDKGERLTAFRHLEKISPADAVGLAEQYLYQEKDADLCRASVEILRKYGTKIDALIAFRSSELAHKHGLEGAIDKAIDSVRAR